MTTSKPFTPIRRRLAALTWMSVVLTLLILIYSYTAWNLTQLWSESSGAESIVHGIAAFLFLSLILVVSGPFRTAKHPALRAWAWCAYVAFAFVTTTALFLLPAQILGWIHPPAASWAMRAAFALSGTALVAGLIGGAKSPRITRITLPVRTLPVPSLTIAQLSDVHVGLTIRRARVQQMVDTMNALAPDLAVITGDIADGFPAHLHEHVLPFSQVSAPLGRFFVTGNHEYYSNAEAWVLEMRSLGWDVLLNEHRTLQMSGEKLTVAGVTDVNGGTFHDLHQSDPRRALAGSSPGSLRILLAHNPASIPAGVEAGADVILVGHTHGGQYFPWTIFIRLFTPFVKGLYKVGETWAFVHRGTGYWGPPLRWGAPSEIALITLQRVHP